MDNKLSELSKPVAWKLHHHDRYYFEENADVVAIAESFGQAKGDALYSQEYVSALIQRAERLDSMLTESVQALKAAEQLNAEAEVRGVEKLAAAFKSWASDETLPDYEAQRHWATANHEALSFAGDLRNGSCDDR
ncbi:TPA: hypothetical protein ACQVG4_001750 [Serratia marcescens]